MLNEEKNILLLKAENKKLKMIVNYLDSLNKKYQEYMKQVGIKIEETKIEDMFFKFTGDIEKDSSTNIPCIVTKRISMPDMYISTRSQKEDILRLINEIINE